jgi:hypothetical protein
MTEGSGNILRLSGIQS